MREMHAEAADDNMTHRPLGIGSTSPHHRNTRARSTSTKNAEQTGQGARPTKVRRYHNHARVLDRGWDKICSMGFNTAAVDENSDLSHSKLEKT